MHGIIPWLTGVNVSHQGFQRRPEGVEHRLELPEERHQARAYCQLHPHPHPAVVQVWIDG